MEPSTASNKPSTMRPRPTEAKMSMLEQLLQVSNTKGKSRIHFLISHNVIADVCLCSDCRR